MPDTDDQTYTLQRAVRLLVDVSGARPGNAAEGLMRWVLQSLRDGGDVVIHATVHDGDPSDMRPFYVVPQDLMRKILADAGIDYRDIP
jgi:threonine dehydrogenase-like Zn-dependent dehydrogenase